MALVARPKAPQHAAKLGFQQALLDFRTVLTETEQARLTSTIQSTPAPNADAVLELTQTIDEANAKGRTRRIGVRLQPFLDGIQQFAAVVDAFIGLGPSIAETIWGIVKMTLLLASNAAKYFEKLTSLLASLVRTVPRYRDYAALYRKSQRLQDALCVYFEQLVCLCRQAVKISRTPAALRIVRTAFWPFDADFGPLEASLQQASQDVTAEVQIAAAKLQVEEAELQKTERLETLRSRSLLKTFSSSARQDFLELQQRWEEYDARQNRRAILQLNSLMCQVDHVRAWRLVHKQAMTGTAEWFKRDDVFLAWCSKPTSTLLRVQGPLGYGKSVLVANVVAHLELTQRSRSKVVHFFCRDTTTSSQTAQTIIRSICSQLIQDSLEDQPLATLDQLVATAGKTESHEILEAVLKHMSPYDTIYLVIDNLDYCTDDELDQVLDAVRELWDHLTAGSCSVKVLLATRSDTRGKISGLFPVSLIMPIQDPALYFDLKSYVENTLFQYVECNKLRFDEPSLAGQVCDYISEGAEGMFLWASLVLEEICIQSTDQAILLLLQKRPPKLEKLFAQTLLRVHTSQQYPYLWNMLMWILGAKRELSLAELCQALSVDAGKDKSMPPRSSIEVTSAIASTRGLVCLDEDDATIRLVHHSFRNFLLDTSRADELTEIRFDATEVQIELAHLCMTFLNYNIFTLSVAKQTSNEGGALVVSQLSGASNYALQNESKAALSVLRARKHLRQLSNRSQSPSDETDRHDIEHRLAERLTRMTETARTAQSHEARYPFLEYARKFWYQHAFSLTPEADNPVWILFRRLFRSKGLHYEQPWYERDAGSSSVPMHGFECLDLATHQSICWSYSQSHMAVMAAALEHQFLPVAEHMPSGAIAQHRMELLTVLDRGLLSPPSERVARVICFRLHNDKLTHRSMNGSFYWHYKTVFVDTKWFLAVRFDFPEYMDADAVKYSEKSWPTRDLKFRDAEALQLHRPATAGRPTHFSLFWTTSADAGGVRHVIKQAIRASEREITSRGEFAVVDMINDRLRSDVLSLLDLSIIFGSRNTLGKMSQYDMIDYEGLIFTALIQGACDTIERYVLKRPSTEKIGSISPSLPIVALWLGREDVADGLSRLLQHNALSENGCQILLSALRHAFDYVAPVVFRNTLNRLLDDSSGSWDSCVEGLTELRRYMGREIAEENAKPELEEMVVLYDTLMGEKLV